MSTIIRKNTVKFVALLLCLVVYGMARLPRVDETEKLQLAERFSFTEYDLPALDSEQFRYIRDVNPSLSHIAAWISSVGAAAAFTDIDNDGLNNDICYVDTRTNYVIITPAPTTGDRYQPFRLKPQPLHYDDATTAPMGVLPGDFNEDGETDILVYFWGRTPIIYLKAEFGFIPTELTDSNDRWFTNAATQADCDGDGHIDLIFGNYFEDNARILDADAVEEDHMHHSMTRAYNGGTNRIFRWSHLISASPGPARIRFEEAQGVFPEYVKHGWSLGVGAADLDGDLLPEIYYAHDFGPDRLLHNLSTPGNIRFAVLSGENKFNTPSSTVLGHDSFKGMGIDFGDVNGDGYLDMYVSNIAAEYALEESHFLFTSTGEIDRMADGVAPYDNHSEKFGLSRSTWGWESRLADFDNDGTLEAVQATGFVKGEINRWPELQELAMGNDEMLRNPKSWFQLREGDDLNGHEPNCFFVRSASGLFTDISPELGIDRPQVTRGIATSDIDGDGDLDFVYANQWDTSRFYLNDQNSQRRFIGFRLLLPLQNEKSSTTILSGLQSARKLGTPAIGATARVALPGGRTLVGEVDGGSGHSGVCSFDLHFGLGDLVKDSTVDVIIRWRDRDGRIESYALTLAPGWYTVLLGGEAGAQAKL